MNTEDHPRSNLGSEEPDSATTSFASVVKSPGWRVLGVALVIVILFLAVWWWRRAGASPEEEHVVVSVRVAKAQKQAISASVSAIGTIVPKQQATVSAKISAPIQQMALLKNKQLHEGDAIAVLESRDLQAQRTEAKAALDEARLELQGLSSGTIPQAEVRAERDLRDAQAAAKNARATLTRRRELFNRGGISKKDLEAAELASTTAEDQLRVAQRTYDLRKTTLNQNERALAEARVKQAEERLNSLEAQLSYATIRAPFTGLITDQFVYKGEYASAGSKLVAIADTSEVIVKAPFADSVVSRLKLGDAAVIRPADSPSEEFTGRVSLISRSTDPSNRTAEVWVNLPNRNGALRAGGAADVTLSIQNVPDAVVVPVSAVTLDASNGASGIVMTVDSQSTAHEQKVTVGIRAAGLIQITSGLKGGETVVTEGGYALPDGAKVQISDSGKEIREEAKRGDKG